MNFKLLAKAVVLVIAVAVTFSMTSCNRGYGCPYELKASLPSISCIK